MHLDTNNMPVCVYACNNQGVTDNRNDGCVLKQNCLSSKELLSEKKVFDTVLKVVNEKHIMSCNL